jgi:hypothetical protein
MYEYVCLFMKVWVGYTAVKSMPIGIYVYVFIDMYAYIHLYIY